MQNFEIWEPFSKYNSKIVFMVHQYFIKMIILLKTLINTG